MNSELHRQRITATASRPRRWIVVGSALGALLTALTGYSAVSQIIGVGTMEHSELVGGPATLTMRTLTIDPGEVLGWHYHPGAGAFTIVTSGMLNVEDGCGGETIYTAGQAFLEPPLRVHRGKNLTTDEVVTAQTFIVPTGLETTVSTGQQLCGAPVAVEECKRGGWTTFNHPRSFVSQGDCIQYVTIGN
jgi:quercetin dioxygenase-like cupin family protein